ncbi:MAG: hypothetical protein AABW68_04945 [archaeon]
MRSSRGQTSLEVLLVISFSILLAMMIGLPYLENQSRTDAGIQAKLAILPFVERNSSLVRISSIVTEVSPGDDLLVRVTMAGEMDAVSSVECDAVCSRIDPAGHFSMVSLEWGLAGETPPFCSSSC